MTFSPQKQKFVDSATDLFGAGSVLNNKQVEDASYSAGIPKAGWFKKQFKIGYNQFKLPNGESVPSTIINTTEDTASNTVSLIATNMEKQNLVPAPFEGFVPWGHFKDIKQVVKSGMFYPVFVLSLIHI